MAKVKVVKTSLNQNLNGEYFNDTPSNTIFSFGKFFVTTNFDNKLTIDYTNSLSSFVRPVTLETMGVSEKQSEIIENYTTNAVLNLDKSDLNTFVRYGSAYEFIRKSIQNIILAYPGSLFVNSQKQDAVSGITFHTLNYDSISNTSTFYVPTGNTVNTFGLVFNNGNTSIPDDNELKNLNESFNKYVIWSKLEPDNNFKIIGYTGNTTNSSNFRDKTNLKLKVQGNPFKLLTSGSSGSVDFHIRPNNVEFEEFRALLSSYEQNIISNRENSSEFNFKIKDPTLLESGKIVYSDSDVSWATSDGYNIDVNTPSYQVFLEVMLTIGAKYDKIKTDLIGRFLTPTSLKTYDITEDGKISKLLRLYGAEFDQLRQFIDSLVNINKVTYDKLNNAPDQIIKNMASTFGWDYFSLVNESELVEGFLTVDDKERNLNDDILPAEIDIELWRRILNNTSYFWKTKGTREAIKSMFLLIGIPEPFINITEYVYTVEGKINPNTVPLTQDDFPSNSLPYDTEGYPKAPLETDDFYFQISGDSDAGQNYLDVFRKAGFNLNQTPDNKKSWVQSGSTTRIHPLTPQYYQEDSKLVINTKEVDIALDTARGIEYDVYGYIQKDFAANSSGYTLPYSYVNISSFDSVVGNTFELPYNVDEIQGDFEVRYNGILLNAPKTGTTTGVSTEADYSVSGNEFTIPELSTGIRSTDVIQATLIATGNTGTALSGISVNYIVTRVKANLNGTYVPLPSYPRGDVQLTINGIALTKGTSQFSADYILDPANSSGNSNNQIIIQNPDVIAYLNENPEIQISYVEVQGSNDINLRSEVIRVDSFNSSKIYFNNSANKYVYKLNYKINNVEEVKLLINGVALEPKKDYNINVQNPYEIFLPRGIKYGTVISAFYLVGGQGAFNPVINDVFGLGDISDLSFLEFLELVERKMVNVRNRKTITNFKGGWYPTILKIYEQYLNRASLANDNPLQSNGYTFENLYPFLSKYNAFFQRFIDQLLSATIIIKKGGLLIRNSIFTKQKHWYKRGVNVASGTTDYDMRGNILLQYFGNDGSTFEINQNINPPPPPPPELYVETKTGVLGSIVTGGKNIIGNDILTSYGIDYKKSTDDNWIRLSTSGSLQNNSFNRTITNTSSSTNYDYRAFVQSDIYGYTGSTKTIRTADPPPPTPSVDTKTGSADVYSINNTGGENIVRYADIQYYGMQYKKSSSGTWILSPNPPTYGSLSNDNYSKTISGLDPETQYNYRARIFVGGSVYYGNTKTITTSAVPTYKPNVRTGSVNLVGTNSLRVNNNRLNSTGGETVTEHGTLYTGFVTQDGIEKGVHGISCISNTSTITDGTYWTDNITGLQEGTKYYYRAYAINSNGIDYGEVKNKITDETPDPPPPLGYGIDLYIDWVDTVYTNSQSGLDGYVQLKCNGSNSFACTLTNFSKQQLVTFNITDTSATYSIELIHIQASISSGGGGGNLTGTLITWRPIGSSGSFNTLPLINNITEECSYDVKVKSLLGGGL